MRRTLPVVTAVVAALLALTACGSSTSSAPQSSSTSSNAAGSAAPSAGGSGSANLTTVKVGVIPIVDVAPLYLGVQQGFFAAQGLQVQPQLAAGGAAIVPAVVSGDYQFGFSNVTSLLLARSKGLPLKIVAAGNYTTGVVGKDFGAVVTAPGSGITGAAGLVGKTVAVNTLNNIGDTTVRNVVAKAGGDPKSLKFVAINFPDMPAAVISKKVDAAWIVEPQLTQAIQQGATVVSWNFAETDPTLMIAGYFASQDEIAKDPKTVAAFTAAMNTSLTYAQAHPDQVRAVLDQYTKIDAAVKSAMVLPKYSPDIDKSAVQVLADLGLKYGLFTSAVDTGSLF